MAATFRAAATAEVSYDSSVTVNKPTGTVEDDSIFACAYSAGGGGFSTPAGWTLESSVTSGSGDAALFKKVAGGSEPANYTFSLASGFADLSVIIASYSGTDTTDPVDVSGSAASRTSPSVTTTAADETVTRWYAGATLGSETVSPPTGNTQRGELEGTSINVQAADKDQAAAGASGTAAFGVTGSPYDEATFTVALKDVASAGGGVSLSNKSTSVSVGIGVI